MDFMDICLFEIKMETFTNSHLINPSHDNISNIFMRTDISQNKNK